MTGVAKEALDKMKKEAEEEELKTNYYTMEKNKKEQEKEEKEIRDRNLAKIELRKYLDMQVEEKKKNSELEKELEKEQARIWKMDCEKYARDEKVIDDKIRRMNKKNLGYLMEQDKKKENMEKNKNKMSDVDCCLNIFFIIFNWDFFKIFLFTFYYILFFEKIMFFLYHIMKNFVQLYFLNFLNLSYINNSFFFHLTNKSKYINIIIF